MMEKIAEYYESEGMPKEAILEREKACELIRIIDNNAYDPYLTFFREKIKSTK